MAERQSTWLENSTARHRTAWRVAFLAMALGIVVVAELVLWLITNDRYGGTDQMDGAIWYAIFLQGACLVGYLVFRSLRRRRT